MILENCKTANPHRLLLNLTDKIDWGRVEKSATSGVILETEGSVSKTQKGHFFTSKK